MVDHQEITNKAKDKANEARDKALDKANDARDRANQAKDKANEQVERIKAESNRVRDEGRRLLTETRDAARGAHAYLRDLLDSDRDARDILNELGGRASEVAQEAVAAMRRGFETLAERGREESGEVETTPVQPATTTPAGPAGEVTPTAKTRRPATTTTPTTARTPAATRPTTDYAELTVEELRELAREADIVGRSQMLKDDLVQALRQHERVA